MELAGIQGLKGTVSVPGDKSISHRCIMFGSIANGTTEIHNFLKGADCLATIRCFQSMGINIEETDHTITVHWKGLHGLSAPLNILDVGNSGLQPAFCLAFSRDRSLNQNFRETSL